MPPANPRTRLFVLSERPFRKKKTKEEPIVVAIKMIPKQNIDKKIEDIENLLNRD